MMKNKQSLLLPSSFEDVVLHKEENSKAQHPSTGSRKKLHPSRVLFHATKNTLKNAEGSTMKTSKH
jgi:hypothetical protein